MGAEIIPTILLVATTNPGKAREIRLVLEGLPLELRFLADLFAVAEPDETGRTCAENARLKAVYYAGVSGWPTVAEDSGLMIDALGGRPGVESARYPGATYPDKFAGLYQELRGHPRPWRAHFRCALSYVDRGGTEPVFEVEATVDGEIADQPRGQYGFGYDPIFSFRPDGCTFGQVGDREKLAVAHRGKAFRAFRLWLERARD